MTDTEILDWLQAAQVASIEFEDGTLVNMVLKDIRRFVIQARDNQDEADGMRAMEGLRG